jgi:toxin ParE1/3/4
MTRFRLSRAAQADLASILEASRERWGESGRTRYAALIAAAMRKTAAHPEGPTTKARTDLASGVRSFHLRHARRGSGVGAPVHVLYYRAMDTGSIEILRVLHERMDPHLHLEGPKRAIRARRRS